MVTALRIVTRRIITYRRLKGAKLAKDSLVVMCVVYISFNLLWILFVNQKNVADFSRSFLATPISMAKYPDTQGGSSSDVLFVGDSYAVGAGDEFNMGGYNYSVAHLYANNKKSRVYNFSHGGYGSIRQVRNAIWLDVLFDKSIFISDLPNLDKIYLFFYEGNDLNNNIREYTEFDDPRSGSDILKISRPTLLDIFFWGHQYPMYEIVVWLKRNLTNFIDANTPRDLRWNKKYSNEGAVDWSTNELQSAGVELNASELKVALEAFAISLEALTLHFEDIPIDVVYIPSVVTVYQNQRDIFRIQSYEHRIESISADINKQRSAIVRKAISDIVMRNRRVTFVDSTECLQVKAKSQPVHGPIDWKHFNSIGNEMLLESIVSRDLDGCK